MMQPVLGDVLETLADMQDDATVPRSIRLRLVTIIDTLNQPDDLSLRINKVLSVLDELQENNNLQGFTRTQLFHLASMLENVHQ